MALYGEKPKTEDAHDDDTDENPDGLTPVENEEAGLEDDDLELLNVAGIDNEEHAEEEAEEDAADDETVDDPLADLDDEELDEDDDEDDEDDDEYYEEDEEDDDGSGGKI
jgi:hypothetical protein